MKNEGRSFINRLRKHRRLMGYTQDDVAYLLDLRSSAQISRWEKGQAIPDTVNVIRLAYILPHLYGRTLPGILQTDEI